MSEKTVVDVVFSLCEGRGIPISRLERECGFSNSYLKHIKGGNIPFDRLKLISNYLGVDIDVLMHGGVVDDSMRKMPVYDAKTFDIIEYFSKLNDSQKELILSMAKELSEANKLIVSVAESHNIDSDKELCKNIRRHADSINK